MNEGVFSLWNGQHAWKLAPAFFSFTWRSITSTMSTRPSSAWMKSCGIIAADYRPRGTLRPRLARELALTSADTLPMSARPASFGFTIAHHLAHVGRRLRRRWRRPPRR